MWRSHRVWNDPRGRTFPARNVSFDDQDGHLALMKMLRALDYRFTPVTSATHRLVNARPENAGVRSVADVFSWSRPFGAGVLPAG